MRRSTWTALLAFAALLGAAHAGSPRLEITGPPELGAAATEIGSVPRDRLVGLVRWTGGGDPWIRPISVLLAPEGSPAAQNTPRDISGYALPERDLVVILPERVVGYPYGSLEALLLHEVTHVLVARAAHSQPVPRWFDEGIASLASRGWRLTDRAHLLLGTWRRTPSSLAELDRAFRGTPGERRAAYALAASLTSHLVHEHGIEVLPALLETLGEGRGFASAYRRVTGRPVWEVEELLSRAVFLHRWLPLLGGSLMWIAITALALVAGVVRRRQVASWEEEEPWSELGLRGDLPSEEPGEPEDELVN